MLTFGNDVIMITMVVCVCVCVCLSVCLSVCGLKGGVLMLLQPSLYICATHCLADKQLDNET
jgi:hypothetical protein